MSYPIPVAERPQIDGKYFVTANVTQSTVSISGRRYIEDVEWSSFDDVHRGSKLLRTARALGSIHSPEDPEERSRPRPYAIFALPTKGGGLERVPLNIDWLKAASNTYDISADPKNYVFVNLPIVTANIPNRNMDCFTTEELTNFSPIQGMMTYRTFIGKATHVNHQNKDPRRARGVHFDSTLKRYTVRPGEVGYSSGADPVSLLKVRVLTGWCREKDSRIAEGILKGKRTAYSMGALLGYAQCSICGQVTTPKPCMHLANKGKGRVINGQLAYDQVHEINFFETSSLDEEPADPDAWEPERIWSGSQREPKPQGR